MTGMGPNSYSITSPYVTPLFRHGLLVALAWIVATAIVVVVATLVSGRLARFNSNELSEPRRRRALRISFGALWLVAGMLQFQSAMPLGMANQVVAPSTEGAPSWITALVNAGIGVYNNHPLALAVAIAWWQVGIGIVLLVSSARTGRVVAALSALYAAFIWVVGNALGGLFSPTGSIFFGWPGATALYAFAGVWLALTPSTFERLFERVTRRSLAVVLAAGALLLAVPSRGFWHGGNANALTAMAKDMASVPQPHWLAAVVRATGVVAGTMGAGFTVMVMMWLGATAVALWRGSSAIAPWSVVIFGLLFWVTVQDLGIFGGLSTDVNTLLPLAVLGATLLPRFSRPLPPPRLPREMRTLSAGVGASFAAAMMLTAGVLFAVAPWGSAETTIYLAANNGGALVAHAVAADFTLKDQAGRPFSLHDTRGHVTVLSFLDPRCWSDCPLLANQLGALQRSFGAQSDLRIVAVAANPRNHSVVDIRRFMSRRHLDGVPHFSFVTGTTDALRSVWRAYNIGVTISPKDKMSVHSNDLFVIDRMGQLRYIVPDEPLATWSGERSAVSELRQLVVEVARQ